MHVRSRLALALGVAVAAAGGIALFTPGVRSTAAQAPAMAPATSQPGTAAPSATGPTTAAPTRTPTTPPTAIASGSGVPGVPGVPGPSGSAGPGATAPAVNCLGHTVPTPVTVKVASVNGQQALVDADGCALYVNTQDTPQVTGVGTQTVFPPAKGPAQAGVGVPQASLGTFIRPDGTIQASFLGHQLYYYANDTQPGQGLGQGLDRSWFLIGPTGTTITG